MTGVNHPSESRLHAYLDRELEPDARRAVEAHLEACSGCQERVAALVTLFERLEEMPEQPLSRDLSAPVVASVRARRRESRLVARLAWAEALVAVGVGTLVWLLTGGLAISAYPSLGLPGTLTRLRGLVDASVELLLGLAVEFASRLNALMAEAAQLSSSPGILEPPEGLSWTPILALVIVVWLIGNGVLLRGSGQRGSR